MSLKCQPVRGTSIDSLRRRFMRDVTQRHTKKPTRPAVKTEATVIRTITPGAVFAGSPDCVVDVLFMADHSLVAASIRVVDSVFTDTVVVE